MATFATLQRALVRKSAAHIGGFEIDICQQVIDLCRTEETKNK